jgi:hypothetical protein
VTFPYIHIIPQTGSSHPIFSLLPHFSSYGDLNRLPYVLIFLSEEYKFGGQSLDKRDEVEGY